MSRADLLLAPHRPSVLQSQGHAGDAKSVAGQRFGVVSAVRFDDAGRHLVGGQTLEPQPLDVSTAPSPFAMMKKRTGTSGFGISMSYWYSRHSGEKTPLCFQNHP